MHNLAASMCAGPVGIRRQAIVHVPTYICCQLHDNGNMLQHFVTYKLCQCGRKDSFEQECKYSHMCTSKKAGVSDVSCPIKLLNYHCIIKLHVLHAHKPEVHRAEVIKQIVLV